MKKRARPLPPSLPQMMMELSFASWETIAHRSLMMMQGRCSPEEYARMVGEKAQAVQASMLALASPAAAAMDVAAATAVLAPWHKGASANAKRLRRK